MCEPVTRSTPIDPWILVQAAAERSGARAVSAYQFELSTASRAQLAYSRMGREACASPLACHPAERVRLHFDGAHAARPSAPLNHTAQAPCARLCPAPRTLRDANETATSYPKHLGRVNGRQRPSFAVLRPFRVTRPTGGRLPGGAQLAPPGATTVVASQRLSRVRGLWPPASRTARVRSRSAALDRLPPNQLRVADSTPGEEPFVLRIAPTSGRLLPWHRLSSASRAHATRDAHSPRSWPTTFRVLVAPAPDSPDRAPGPGGSFPPVG